MRRRRCLLASEIYFITVRTVNEQFALTPYAPPGAWTPNSIGPALENSDPAQNARRGQNCVRDTESLARRVADAEAGKKTLPHVSSAAFSDSIPNIIGSWLARAVSKYHVKLYGFVAMSNHIHLLIQAPLGNMAEFMAYFNGQVAREVNRFLGRRHHLWARRYSAAQVLDEPAELERLLYILSNPQNARIVNSIEQWPGVSSWSSLFGAKKQRFLSFNRSKWYLDGRPENIAPYLSTVVLEHDILPQFQRMPTEQWKALLRQQLHCRSDSKSTTTHNRSQKRRRDAQRRVRNAIAMKAPTDRPATLTKSPQPLCHSTIPELSRAFAHGFRRFVHVCQARGKEYKEGNVNVAFPRGAFAPSRYPIARTIANPNLGILPDLAREQLQRIAALNREDVLLRLQ